MNFLATLANTAWLTSSLPAWQRYRQGLHAPAAAQHHILRRLLSENAASAFGRAHQFAAIRHYEDFCERVPITDYAGLEPRIHRIVRGEASVLTRDAVTHLVPTSGSSGARKLIPFTTGFQREFNAAIGPWMVDLCRQFPSTALGPAYWSVSPDIPDDDSPSAVPIGFENDSAYLGGVRQKLVEAALAVPSALRLVPDVEDARYFTLLCLLRQPDLRLVSVWHPSFLALLLDALPVHWAELSRDLATGNCPRANAYAPEVQRAMTASPQRRRARVTSPCPRSLWPRWQIVSCWGDAQAALAFAALQQRLPDLTLQPKGLLATEGVVTIPFRGRHPVAIQSHFYEFTDAAGNVRRAHELQPGAVYRVILTTGGGLWRYRLDDEVEVDGFVDATPSLRFRGRGAKVSDLCGEKLHESFVTTAITEACRETGFTTEFAMLAPELTNPPRYTLYVHGSPPDRLPALLEAKLSQNPHYALCRKLGQLAELDCCLVSEDAPARFLAAQAAPGKRLGDIKPESLSLHPGWREKLTG